MFCTEHTKMHTNTQPKCIRCVFICLTRVAEHSPNLINLLYFAGCCLSLIFVSVHFTSGLCTIFRMIMLRRRNALALCQTHAQKNSNTFEIISFDLGVLLAYIILLMSDSCMNIDFLMNCFHS